MSVIINKLNLYEKEGAFKQWKRGAFFMKTCELIYVFRYQDHEETTIKRCFKEWSRLLKHQRNKDYQYDSLRLNHHYHTLKGIFSSWKLALRPTLLAHKLTSLILPKYHYSL